MDTPALAIVLGLSAAAVASGLTTLAAALKRLQEQMRDRNRRPKPSHVSVVVRYEDGHFDEVEVDPHNPAAVEAALTELRHA